MVARHQTRKIEKNFSLLIKEKRSENLNDIQNKEIKNKEEKMIWFSMFELAISSTLKARG